MNIISRERSNLILHRLVNQALVIHGCKNYALDQSKAADSKTSTDSPWLVTWAHDEHCLVLSKHTELGGAPGLLSHGDRPGNWASRRAATRRCCLPPGQMQSESWRAGAGHQRSADCWESVRDCTASTHTTPVATDALALEPDREKQRGRGRPSGPWQTEPACCVEVPGAYGPKDERRTTLDLLSGLTHEHLC